MTEFDSAPNYSRRRLLAAGAASCILPFLPGCSGMPKTERQIRYLSAATHHDEIHTIGGIDAGGTHAMTLSTGIRCHSGAIHPTAPGIAVVFSRRPGTRMFVVDTINGRMIRAIDSPQDRHFYGHGCFSLNGDYLYTTENDYEAGTGVIGIWDGKTYTRLGEILNHGTGPHDIRLLSNDKTLIVANGGIRTHPDYRRRKLNLKSMQPSLVYIDSADGSLMNRFTLENRFLSIRHLAVNADDTVGIAFQYEGPQRDIVPLVAIHCGSGPIATMHGPTQVIRRMRHYTASICIHPHQGIAGVTCPRGNIVTFWNLKSRELIKTIEILDAGGIAIDPSSKNFIISTGTGKIFQVNPANFSRQLLYADNAMQWDNHLMTNRLSTPKHQTHEAMIFKHHRGRV